MKKSSGTFYSKIGTIFIGVISLLLFVSTLNLNQVQATPQDSKDLEKGKLEIRNEDEAKFLQGFEIFGRVEKPQTVFIIPGQDPSVDDIIIKREFFKEIFRPVEKATVTSKESKSKQPVYIPY
ncbi:hypothetical protein JW964_28460 [candidate division KSB1 bacterium]|nr:hypothetical protein [candidate division KSB1 bacterium]